MHIYQHIEYYEFMQTTTTSHFLSHHYFSHETQAQTVSLIERGYPTP